MTRKRTRKRTQAIYILTSRKRMVEKVMSSQTGVTQRFQTSTLTKPGRTMTTTSWNQAKKNQTRKVGSSPEPEDTVTNVRDHPKETKLHRQQGPNLQEASTRTH